jgi:ribosomal protein L16 Arg81 hydroxylase
VHEHSLQTLLDPIDIGAFFRNTWEQQPLHIARGSANYYEGLPSAREIDALLYFTRPEVLVTRGVIRKAGRELERTMPSPHQVDLGELRDGYDRGETLVVNQVQRRNAAVARLCRTLECELHHPFNANLYLTPARGGGFSAHYDLHDLFILQIEGRKRWSLYANNASLPLESDRTDFDPESAGPVVREINLEAGDLLYLPRGTVHSAKAGDQASLHLAMGALVYRWVDLMRHALEELAERDVRFRTALPPGHLTHNENADNEENAALARRFDELAQAIRDSVSVKGARAHLGDQFFARDLPLLPDGRFAAMEIDPAIELDTPLVKRHNTPCRVIVGAQAAEIEFPGKRIAGPAWLAPALEFVSRTPRFRARDLPNGMSDNSKLVLVRRLYRGGLLRSYQQP